MIFQRLSNTTSSINSDFRELHRQGYFIMWSRHYASNHGVPVDKKWRRAGSVNKYIKVIAQMQLTISDTLGKQSILFLECP